MVSTAEARALALALPEAVEQDHHGFPSFRIRGKIFATLPDPDHLHVMLTEDEIREAVAIDPRACEEKWWGKKLAAVRVALPSIQADVLDQLLADAWRLRAPRELQPLR